MVLSCRALRASSPRGMLPLPSFSIGIFSRTLTIWASLIMASGNSVSSGVRRSPGNSAFLADAAPQSYAVGSREEAVICVDELGTPGRRPPVRSSGSRHTRPPESAASVTGADAATGAFRDRHTITLHSGRQDAQDGIEDAVVGKLAFGSRSRMGRNDCVRACHRCQGMHDV